MPHRSPTAPAAAPHARAELRELLRLVRAEGFATEDGEVTLGLRSVGVAVADHTGWPIAAIALTYPDDVPKNVAELAAMIAPAAAELGRRIGGAGAR